MVLGKLCAGIVRKSARPALLRGAFFKHRVLVGFPAEWRECFRMEKSVDRILSCTIHQFRYHLSHVIQ